MLPPSPDDGRPRSAVRTGLLALGLLVLPVLLYSGYLDSPLSPDARLLSGGAGRSLADAWRSDFFAGAGDARFDYRTGYFRPVTNTVFWLLGRAGGQRALPYNLVEMLLHGANAALLLRLLVGLGWGATAAVAAALLFAVHPVHAYAATEPAALADVLFPAFYLAGMVAFDAALRAPSGARRALGVGAAVLLYLLALLSKETGITFPAALVLLVLYRHARGEAPLARLAWTLPAWAAMGGWLAVRFGVLSLPMQDFGFVDRHGWGVVAAATAKSVLIHTARILLPMGASYPELHPTLVNRLQPPFTDPLFHAGLLVTAALVAGALPWKRRAAVAFGCAFFLVAFSPLVLVDHIAGALNPDVVPTEERWIYLPSVGLFALVGLGFARLVARRRKPAGRRAALAGGVAVLALLAWASVAHAGRYFDPYAQLRRLYLFPEEGLHRRELANRLLLYAEWVALPRGELADAEARARRAHELVPDSPVTANGLATVLAERGRWEEVRAVVEPWLAPGGDALEAARATNPEVTVDLYRVAGRLALLLGRATLRLEGAEAARPWLCQALGREAPARATAAALAEAGTDPATCPPLP